jgi:hypothetical protein
MDVSTLSSYLTAKKQYETDAKNKATQAEKEAEEKPDAVDPNAPQESAAMASVKTHATFFGRFLTLTIAFFVSTLWAGLFIMILNRHLNYEKTASWKAILIVLAITIIFILIVYLFDLEHVRMAF